MTFIKKTGQSLESNRKIGMRKIEVGKYNTTEKDEQVKNLKPDFIEWVKEKNSLDYKIYNYRIEKFEQF
jgi:hypothetical protein